MDGDQHALQATLTGHDGPVWEVAWGHPQWGSTLASCGYDGQVIVCGAGVCFESSMPATNPRRASRGGPENASSSYFKRNRRM